MHKLKATNATRLLGFILLGLFLFYLSNTVDELRVYQGATVAMYVIAISSIILLTGYSGQVSLGHGALLAIGGYGAALVRNNFNAPIWIAFIAAILLAAFWGALLGATAARLSGPYLAGTTLALAVGLPSIANQFKFLGGEQGLIFDIGLPPAWLGQTFSQYKWFFWIAALTALIAMWWLQNLLRSGYGRTWRAVRTQSVAAELAGINIARSKILAFTLSAGLAGLAGAVLSMTISTVSPGAFPLSLSFALATGAVLSGVTTLGGVIIGSVTLVAIPEIADVVAHQVGASENATTNLPGLMVSGLLIVAVLFVPNGPVEQLKKKRSK